MPPKRVRTVEGSCWPCKERRIKCDIKYPKCDRCMSRGLFCDYGKLHLRWASGLPSKALQSHAIQGIRNDPNCRTIVPRSPAIVLDTEHYLLYFELELIPRFHLLESFVGVDLISVLDNPVLLRSATAVASAHHTFRNANCSIDVVLSTTRSRADAIKVVRQHLFQGDSRISPRKLFTANALLCILDGMIAPDMASIAAQVHLCGGKAILDLWSKTDDLFSNKTGVPMLMLSVFASMDLTHSLLSGNASYFDDSSWLKFSNVESWWGVLEPNDPFLQIHGILGKMATLGYRVRTTRIAVSMSELLSIQLMLERTRNLQPLLLDGGKSSGDTASPTESWMVFCSAYRFAALIYMYRVLGNLDIGEELVQETVREGVETICHKSLSGKLGHCVLFPALILGSHCTNELQRQQILKVIHSSASYLSFGCVQSLDDFLREVWETDMKLSWWECFGEMSQKAFFF